MENIILTHKEIAHKTKRIAYQIYETFVNEDEVILAGIANNGYIFAQKDIQKKIQTQFIMAENGSIIMLDEGTFTFTASLSLEGKKNIIIRGKGKDKTILSFKLMLILLRI